MTDNCRDSLTAELGRTGENSKNNRDRNSQRNGVKVKEKKASKTALGTLS